MFQQVEPTDTTCTSKVCYRSFNRQATWVGRYWKTSWVAELLLFSPEWCPWPFQTAVLGAPCEPVHQTTQKDRQSSVICWENPFNVSVKIHSLRELAVDETMLKFRGRFIENHTCQRNPLNGGHSASAWQTAAMATSSMFFFSVVVEHSVEQAASSCCIPSQYLQPKLPSLHHFPVRAVLWLHRADLLDSSQPFLWRQCCKVRCCYSLSVWLWATDEAVQPVDEWMY